MKFLKSKVPFIISIALLVLFNIIFLTIVFTTTTNANDPESAGSFWVSYVFIDIAFILIALFCFFFKLKSKNAMTMILPFFFSLVGYLLLTLVVNAIMMAIPKVEIYWPIIVNAVLVIICSIIVLICFKSYSLVADNTEKMQKRVRELRETSIKVNTLVYQAKDEEVKAALKKFKQNIDYSSPAGTPSTVEYEEQIDDAINTLKDLIAANADKESMLEAIQAAEQALKVRNQVLMASR